MYLKAEEVSSQVSVAARKAKDSIAKTCIASCSGGYSKRESVHLNLHPLPPSHTDRIWHKYYYCYLLLLLLLRSFEVLTNIIITYYLLLPSTSTLLLKHDLRSSTCYYYNIILYFINITKRDRNNKNKLKQAFNF